MAGELVKVDGVWNLTADTAKRLDIKPSKLLEYFAEKHLKPFLVKAYAEKSKELGRELEPNEKSKLRRGFGQVIHNGRVRKLSSINQYFDNPNETTAGDLLKLESARGPRAVGMGPIGELQATFYDDIAKFKDQRDKALSQANRGSPSLFESQAGRERRIEARFDNQMKQLFNSKENRKWLPKDAYYDPLTFDDQYGWKEGQSREDFFAYQRKVYADSGSISRAVGQKYGLKFDAGHFKALGPLKISKEEFEKLKPTHQAILKDGGEPDPKNKGGWIIYGTNAASNLGIQIANHNRANKNFDARDIENILDIEAAFTKTLAFNEYLLKDDTSFRKNTDYAEAFRSLLGHNRHLDINAIVSKAEDARINEGPPKNQLQKLETGLEGNTLNIYNTKNPVTSYKVDPNRLAIEDRGSSDLDQFALPPKPHGVFRPNKSGVLTFGGIDQPGAKDSLEYVQKELPKAAAEHGVNLLGARTGNKQLGTQLRRGIEAVDAARKGQPVTAAVSAYQAVSPGITTISPLDSKKRNLLQSRSNFDKQIEKSNVLENLWNK